MTDLPHEDPMFPHEQFDHEAAMNEIRHKMESVAAEYAAGKLNSAQFNAIYRHYMEKRTIIEKLLERNPETDAWRSVAEAGTTSILRQHYQSRPIHYVVFRRGEREPLIANGKITRQAARQIFKMLKVIWSMTTHRSGLARKSLGKGLWLVLAMGENAMTLVLFSHQPTNLQTNRVRDLHSDFERANGLSLQRGLPAERMVFPQRALMEES